MPCSFVELKSGDSGDACYAPLFPLKEGRDVMELKRVSNLICISCPEYFTVVALPLPPC